MAFQRAAALVQLQTWPEITPGFSVSGLLVRYRLGRWHIGREERDQRHIDPVRGPRTAGAEVAGVGAMGQVGGWRALGVQRLMWKSGG